MSTLDSQSISYARHSRSRNINVSTPPHRSTSTVCCNTSTSPTLNPQHTHESYAESSFNTPGVSASGVKEVMLQSVRLLGDKCISLIEVSAAVARGFPTIVQQASWHKLQAGNGVCYRTSSSFDGANRLPVWWLGRARKTIEDFSAMSTPATRASANQRNVKGNDSVLPPPAGATLIKIFVYCSCRLLLWCFGRVSLVPPSCGSPRLSHPVTSRRGARDEGDHFCPGLVLISRDTM